jgi:sulfite reductase alpha subunit-like flavoprotein
VFLQGESEYEEWKYHKNKNIVEVIEEFSSLTVPAALLLTQLPRLQPVKFQSIQHGASPWQRGHVQGGGCQFLY